MREGRSPASGDSLQLVIGGTALPAKEVMAVGIFLALLSDDWSVIEARRARILKTVICFFLLSSWDEDIFIFSYSPFRP